MAAVQKRKIKWAISLFLVMLYFSGLPAYAQYGGGSGTVDDPFLIYTAEQMNAIGLHEEDWNKHFKLMDDIDLAGFTGTDFNIIGYYVSLYDNEPFTGVLDGNGKKISNFSYTSADANGIGLFGCILGANVHIKDLGLINPNVNAGTGNYVGSLVGYLAVVNITNCYVEGGSVSGNEVVGGLVGLNDGEITECYSRSSVSGDISVGGLGGENKGTITNCYATGRVSGDQKVGGLVGRTEGIITNSYATGSVSGNQWVGGLVGYNMWSQIYRSFWDTKTSGQPTSSGGRGKTTAEMKMTSTFVNEGWDFSTPIWTIDEGVDYPRLWWERQEPSKYGGGNGTAEEPYLIHTYQQMNAIGANSNDWDKHFKLMADIDLSGFTGTDFNIIGYYISDDDNKPFTGVFDGSGKKISNFSYSCTDINRIGLFGYVDDPNAEIKDLELIDPNVDAGTGDDVGSLVGYMDSGTIDGCYAQGGSVSGNEDVGGLVGLNKGLLNNCHSVGNVTGNFWVGGLLGVNGGTLDRCYSEGSVLGNLGVAGLVGYNVGTITDCYATGNVWGTQGVGGLVGYNDDGTITNCYANCYVTGGVSGNNWYFGGLVGSNFGTVSDCYAASSVSGELFVGGLVGRNDDKITRCYSVGSVTGRSRVGGLVGGNEEGTITDSFWDTQTSGQYKMCGNTGPEGSGCDNTNGKTTAEMQMASTYTNTGWDFVGQPDGPHDIWAEPLEGGYPILSWQLPHRLGLPTFSGGTGEPDDPYLISTAEDLNRIGHNPRLMEEHFKLINDIDLSGIDFFVIGKDLYPFGGVFDGNGKKISNFTYASTDEDLVGLFRDVEGATIKDLGLINSNVDGTTRSYTGSLVGFIRYGAIKGCYVRNGYVSGYFVVGGLIGRTYLTALYDCYSEGTVSGEKTTGGLVGINHAGTITNCYSVGSVTGATEVGGLVGMNDFSMGQGFFQLGIITKCYATGNINGQMCVGGLVGDNLGKITDSYATGDVVGFGSVGGLVGHNYLWSGELVIPPTISSCYAVGSVSGSYSVGGLMGADDGGTVTESFWDIENSGQITSDGGTGKTTAQMQMATTFLNAGWDFVDETANGTDDIWWILEGQDYPRLWWEKVSD